MSCKEITSGLPSEFATYLSYVRCLKFTDKPDYNWIRNLFRKCYEQHSYAHDLVFDWTEPPSNNSTTTTTTVNAAPNASSEQPFHNYNVAPIPFNFVSLVSQPASAPSFQKPTGGKRKIEEVNDTRKVKQETETPKQENTNPPAKRFKVDNENMNTYQNEDTEQASQKTAVRTSPTTVTTTTSTTTSTTSSLRTRPVRRKQTPKRFLGGFVANNKEDSDDDENYDELNEEENDNSEYEQNKESEKRKRSKQKKKQTKEVCDN